MLAGVSGLRIRLTGRSSLPFRRVALGRSVRPDEDETLHGRHGLPVKADTCIHGVRGCTANCAAPASDDLKCPAMLTCMLRCFSGLSLTLRDRPAADPARSPAPSPGRSGSILTRHRSQQTLSIMPLKLPTPAREDHAALHHCARNRARYPLHVARSRKEDWGPRALIQAGTRSR